MKKLFIIFIILFSCEENSESILSASSGNLNEISTVLSDELWDGAVGKTLKESFSKPIYGLPQREPLWLVTSKSTFHDQIGFGWEFLVPNRIWMGENVGTRAGRSSSIGSNFKV